MEAGKQSEVVLQDFAVDLGWICGLIQTLCMWAPVAQHLPAMSIVTLRAQVAVLASYLLVVYRERSLTKTRD